MATDLTQVDFSRYIDAARAAIPQTATPTAAPPPAATTVTPNVPDYLLEMFSRFGLNELAAWYVRRVVEGATDAQIAAEIYDQPAYQRRFPAMAALRQRGRAISEAEYMAVERSYADTLAAYGLRGSVYDRQDTFTRLIESEVSVRELEERVADAKMVVDATDSNVKNALLVNYGISSNDLLAYALDPKGRGKDYVERLARSATLQGIAKSMGLGLAKGYAENLAMDSAFDNSTEADYREALSSVSDLATTQKRLAAIDRQKFTDADAADAVIKRDSTKILASRARAQREQARFSGSAGVSSGSLRRGSL